MSVAGVDPTRRLPQRQAVSVQTALQHGAGESRHALASRAAHAVL